MSLPVACGAAAVVVSGCVARAAARMQLVQPKVETVQATRKLQVILMNGTAIEVDLKGVNDVAEIRTHVATACGTTRVRVQLFTSGGAELKDGGSISQPCCDGHITVVLASPGPSWYPPLQYMHDNKEVLKILIWQDSCRYTGVTAECEVVYLDGTSLSKDSDNEHEETAPPKGGGKGWRQRGSKGQDVLHFAYGLISQFGFVDHCVYSCIEECSQSSQHEAVPKEDPGQWEEWESLHGFPLQSGERRIR